MTGRPGTGSAASLAPGVAADEFDEDVATQRRRMRQVWAAGGSALAAMVAVSWYGLASSGGRPRGGDMVVHAATAEWLRTLPWWDWRGWSDWFYGGQAIGVTYPPLGHAWLRFTHPGHGQMAAVAIGLVVLLPWGSWRLARAVGYTPRGQRAAVGAVLGLVAFSGTMHWFLPGFHYSITGFGGWPAMLAVVLGLFCAAWAACCGRPVACGVVAGVAVLFNSTVVPGIAVVCLVLLASSGASPRKALRWGATAGSVALAVCAWWLVPFVAGWDRLVPWVVPLRTAWGTAGIWGIAVVALVAAGAVRAARSGSAPARRLALATAAALLATLVGDRYGYLRSERWLALGLLTAAAAAGGLFDRRPDGSRPRRPAGSLDRPAGVAVVALAVLAVAAARRYEVLPLAVWLLWGSRRTWMITGAVTWAGVLLFVPVWATLRHPPPPPAGETPLEAVASVAGSDGSGVVYLDGIYNTPAGDPVGCGWGQPGGAWRTTAATAGRIRPLAGLYRETSPTAEFLNAESRLRGGQYAGSDAVRPHWLDAWLALDGPPLDTHTAAEALGARWFVECDADGNLQVTELSPVAVSGVTVTPHRTEEAWHRDAVEWWIVKASGSPDGGFPAVPIRTPGDAAAHPYDEAAAGVTLHTDGDRLTVRAEQSGWAWLRVPWDPDWRSLDGTPVHLGGPGHLVVWANEGTTELHWSVSRRVDVASAATTGVAALVAAVLLAPALVERRRRARESELQPPPGTG